MWEIRPRNQCFDAIRIYEGYPTMFTIELHHGGRFTKFPGISYIEGKLDHIDLVDMDEFSVHELDEVMLKLGYDVPPVIYYHYQLPNGDLEFGLRALGNDIDVLSLAQYIEHHKIIKVYTEHNETKLLTYFMSPRVKPRVIIEEIADDVPTATVGDQDVPNLELCLVRYETPEYNSNKRLRLVDGSQSCSKKLCFNLEHTATVGDQDAHVEIGNEGANISEQGATVSGQDTHVEIGNEGANVSDQGATVGNQDTEVHDQGANVGDQEVNTREFDTFDDQPFQFEDFDPFFDQYTFNDGNDQSMGVGAELGTGLGEVQFESEGVCEGLGEGGSEGGSEGSEEDSDFLEDEENYVSDIEVDMSDFYMNVDLDVEYVDRGKGVETENEVVDTEDVEDVEVIDNDEWDSLGEDSDDERRKAILKQMVKEKKCSLGEVHTVTFQVGQKYKSKKEIKNKVNKLAIETRRNLGFKKNDKTRLRVVCKGNVPNVNASGVGKGNKLNCSWSMQTSRSKDSDYWYVKTLLDKHTCVQTRKLRACTAKYISAEILDMVESNPTVPLRSIQEQVQKRLQVGVSIHKVQRAKATATKQVSGDYTKQYEVLRDYLMELQATNVGTTVKLEVVNEPNSTRETRQFKRVYICLGALKKGFKAGLRDILGLDGAFMKGPFPGQVLTAVGLDSNNGIYPLAYAIVETENMSSWKWFLECLGDDLELCSNSNFTFMSDRQKGLLPAIAQLYPQAEHRFCLRHIYENMRKKWKTKEYKDHLWQCAIATTVPEFEHYMNELNKFDKDAFEWLKKIPPHHWARSHFSGRAGSDILLNNLCEVFNSKLIHGRNKPIISCLEYIRQYLMKRICNVKKVMSKAPGPLTPTASKLLERNREASVQYRARWNGTAKYEVYGPWHDQHVVDMKNMSCTCRRWELNGIPCRHAIATIHEMADSGDKVGELYTYVNKVYWLQTWNEAYSYTVDPIKGRAMWPKSTCPFQLTPPPHHNQPGRPNTKRKRSADEKYDKQMQNHGAGEPEKLTRKFVSVRCGKCNNRGHNSRTCKGQGGNAGRNEGGNAGSSQGGNA
ncbi:unnamed protein product [Lactuca saligna]|uniref:SWIM-type domain-containing protein n=1 Tax=Lactuca saligna TaxID=75948 RepID=A0AA35YL16_LACSI|nr:unnamed protein product [Lactuca saligna]CAI9275869.1 unnamed protein product [Lactuca saligna]